MYVHFVSKIKNCQPISNLVNNMYAEVFREKDTNLCKRTLKSIKKWNRSMDRWRVIYMNRYVMRKYGKGSWQSLDNGIMGIHSKCFSALPLGWNFFCNKCFRIAGFRVQSATDTAGEGAGGTTWKRSTDVCINTRPCVKQTASGKHLQSQRSSARSSVPT